MTIRNLASRCFAVVTAGAAPVVALAQYDSPTGGPSTMGSTFWFWVFLAVIAAVVAGLIVRVRQRRNGPHGPQSPTPRGP